MKDVVYLVAPILGVRSFSPEHAAGIMAIPEAQRGGWRVPTPEELTAAGIKIKEDAVDGSTNKGNTARKARKRKKPNPTRK